MAFEGVSAKLQAIFKKLNGRGKLTEADVNEAMREIKLALLEADVNFLVVKDFIKTVTARAVGGEVLESLTPGQQVIKIVSEEMTRAHGRRSTQSWTWSPSVKNPPFILLCRPAGLGQNHHVLPSSAQIPCDNTGKKPLPRGLRYLPPRRHTSSCRLWASNSGVPVFTKRARRIP